MAVLRPAIIADATAIAAVHRAALWGAVPHLRRRHTDAETAAYYAAEVLPRGETTVSVDGSAITGFAVLDGEWLEQLHVAPAAQGTGVGRALLAWALEQRPDGLQLWTFQANARARAFYERAGFTAVEHTDGARNEEREPDVRYVRLPR